MSAREFVGLALIIVVGFFAVEFATNMMFPSPAPVMQLPETADQQILIDLLNQNERQQDMNRDMRDVICKVNFNQDKELYGEEYAHEQMAWCITIVD